MKKKRISLSARSYAIIIVIMILVYAQVLIISNGAYRQAVFSPYEQRLAEAKIPAESMVPFLDGLTRYLGTEELRRAREGLDKDETGILYFLGDHATVLEDGMESTAATDLILLRDALNECRESLFADGVYAEGKSAVLTSMIKRVETSTLIALNEIASGTFKGGVVNLALKDDGVDYSKANKALGIKVIDAIEAAKKDIVSGKVKILPTYKEALAAGIAPEGLGAIDD